MRKLYFSTLQLSEINTLVLSTIIYQIFEDARGSCADGNFRVFCAAK